MSHTARPRTRSEVYGPRSGERRVHDRTDKQEHRAGPGGGLAQHLLGARQRPCMAVHLDLQSGRRSENITYRHIAPAELRMLDDQSGLRVHPVSGGHPQTEHRPSSRMGRQQPGKASCQVTEDPLRFGASVRLAVHSQDPAAQVHEGDGRVGDGDMCAGHQMAAGVDLQRYVGPPQSLRPGGLRTLADETTGHKPAGVSGHGCG